MKTIEDESVKKRWEDIKEWVGLNKEEECKRCENGKIHPKLISVLNVEKNFDKD